MVHRYFKNLLILLSLFIGNSVCAQEHLAFENQYVVKPLRASSAGIRALSVEGDLLKLGRSGFYTLTSNHRPEEVGVHSSGSIGIRQVFVRSNDKFCRNLLRKKLAKSCSPNYVLRSSDISTNDPKLSELWGMQAGSGGANAIRGWGRGHSASDVVVAIIDTGIDYTHQDLSQNIWTNPGEIPGNNVDDDANGVIDDVHGVNFVNNSGNPMDDNSSNETYHGTHVAGTIGAIGNNAVGVVGVAWNVKMMGLKFLDSSGSGSLGNAIKAIDYMVMMKNRGVNVRVANNSWGGGSYAQPLFESIERAKAAGIVFVAAAGNEANDNDEQASYPAGYQVSNVMSVAALDSDGNLAGFSNYGQRSVLIGAPGVAIVSTKPGNAYQSLSGTSMATPHVSGALALLFAQHPEYTPEQAIDVIMKSGSATPSLTTTTRSQRRLDVGRMMYGEVEELPPVADSPSSCAYSVSEVPYSSDYSIVSEPIVISGDEGAYHEVALPFDFPFHREVLNKIYVSLNGVVYFKKAPSSADFMPGAYAPAYSIAALHSDLVSDAAPYGVRVSTSSERVVVEWKMRYFLSRSSGGVLVQLVLTPDGVVKDYVSFEDSDTLDRVASRSVVGVGAPNFTEGTNNPIPLSSRLGLQFVPACSGGVNSPTAPVVRSVRVTRTKRNIPTIANVDVKGVITGRGSGAVGVRVSVGSRECVSSKSFILQDGQVRFTARVPRLLRIYKTLKITSGSITSVTNIGPKLDTGSKTSRTWRVTRKDFDRECLRLGRSLRVS